MLISESYRELQVELHKNPDYGTSGYKMAERLMYLCGSRDILDYGCGKKTLEMALGFKIKNYDPCIKGNEVAIPSEVVACTDVLEHIEPEHLEEVLADLRRVTKGVCYMTIASKPARKVLADGRNAHLIQEGVEWWLFRLSKYFDIFGCVLHKNGFEVLAK